MLSVVSHGGLIAQQIRFFSCSSGTVLATRTTASTFILLDLSMHNVTSEKFFQHSCGKHFHPYALCHLWLHGRLFAQKFSPCGQCYPRNQNNHMASPVKVPRQQTTPELSGSFRTLPPEPTETRAGTLRNPPEPSEPCLRNLHQHAAELSRNLRNLPRPFQTNLSEPSGIYLLNLRQHKPEHSEIFRNLSPEPTPFYIRTLPNLPEPACGNYNSTRRNSPEPSGTFPRNLLLRPAPADTGAYLGWRPH